MCVPAELDGVGVAGEDGIPGRGDSMHQGPAAEGSAGSDPFTRPGQWGWNQRVREEAGGGAGARLWF